MTYAAPDLLEEVAYVAYHLHWGFDEILDLEHPDRHQLIETIGRFNAPADWED